MGVIASINKLENIFYKEPFFTISSPLNKTIFSGTCTVNVPCSSHYGISFLLLRFKIITKCNRNFIAIKNRTEKCYQTASCSK